MGRDPLANFDPVCGPPAGIIFCNWNPGGVSNGPTSPTIFSITTTQQVAEIIDYHYPNGPAAGTIGLKEKGGRVFGPWKITASIGFQNTPNVIWTARFHTVLLPAGTYQVIDSSPATWSIDGESGGQGFSEVRAFDPASLAPHITAVDFSSTGQNLHFVVHGSSFGSPPVPMPFTGNVPGEDFYFYDLTHAWTAGHGTDGITVRYASWSDTQIVVDGFGNGYGTDGWVATPGDKVHIGVVNKDSAQTTEWAGTLPSTTPSPSPLSAAWEAPYDGFTAAPGDHMPLSAGFTSINGNGVFPSAVQFGIRLPHGRWMTICTVGRSKALISGDEVAKRNGIHHTIEVATYTCAHDASIPLHAQAGQAALSFNAIISHGRQVNAPAGIRYGKILTPDLPVRGPIQTYKCLAATYLNACPGIPVKLMIRNQAATSATIAVATFCNLSVPSPACQDDNPNDYSATVMWDDATDIRPGGEAALKAELQNPQNHHIVPNAPIVRIEPAPKDGGRLAVVTTHLFQPVGQGSVNYFVVISSNRRSGRSVVVTGHVDVAMPYDPRQYADGTRLGDTLGSNNNLWC